MKFKEANLQKIIVDIAMTITNYKLQKIKHYVQKRTFGWYEDGTTQIRAKYGPGSEPFIVKDKVTTKRG